eukprot:13552621-Alexandrium_andersonii.AAC.1
MATPRDCRGLPLSPGAALASSEKRRQREWPARRACRGQARPGVHREAPQSDVTEGDSSSHTGAG